MRKRLLAILGIFILVFSSYFISRKVNLNPTYEVGQKMDSLNGVFVYHNGGVGHVDGRELTEDGYNIGLRYQCVEFVKRYYYEKLNHQMPNTYGHAKDFFDSSKKDGARNEQRDLYQFTNPSSGKPEVDDLVVYSGTLLNKYGHVAIISRVDDNEIEIIQQNPGPFGKSREKYGLTQKDGKWQIENDRILGWLRK